MENSSGLVYQVDTQGGKISTTQVVDKAIALKQEAEKAKQRYDAVRAVFDRDDFRAASFDQALN